jgi:hypothetical protein
MDSRGFSHGLYASSGNQAFFRSLISIAGALYN